MNRNVFAYKTNAKLCKPNGRVYSIRLYILLPPTKTFAFINRNMINIILALFVCTNI